MYLGKVIGTVVATRKDENLIGSKLMITQPLNMELEPIGEPLIAVDTVGAGIGELVIFTKGTAARIAARKMDAPIDISIVGIVDQLTIDHWDSRDGS
ncbi:Carbon dioxide concentrating mechanism protein CcmL [[Clostridium] ultunense Esp]|uniref:Carbon dioxide concentrating mechanism protein CcmL n=1 Tax=[Clostridium] ultunense Esp TaxID=1288971 RepID=M1ZLY6_9FIRM|nr:EutN/CcmL family microcompartment protein [Schnuerera ultunensis]CCQ98017.1 Carbon dioxide concentrating mechanism protein CcmL [[Clostridium] ultunense Esp]SHD76340.1 Carbon dioxide concentrating mechanism protein CcmL [[Clostridium] ultunense Esp]